MSNQKKKKKKEEKKNPLDDVPAHLRDFIESIALKEQPESPGSMRKKAQLKRKEALENTEEATNIKQMMSGVSPLWHLNNWTILLFFIVQNYQFTDLEIMTLWNSFRIDFPEGQISAPQLQDVVRRVFPKYEPS